MRLSSSHTHGWPPQGHNQAIPPGINNVCLSAYETNSEQEKSEEKK
jgi:hypothetical protein